MNEVRLPISLHGRVRPSSVPIFFASVSLVPLHLLSLGGYIVSAGTIRRVVLIASFGSSPTGFLLILEPFETDNATVPNPIFHFTYVSPRLFFPLSISEARSTPKRAIPNVVG